MAYFNEDIHHRASMRLEQIVPEFIRTQYPLFLEFLRGYYEFLEQYDTKPITPVYVPQQGVVTIVAGSSTVTGNNTTFTLVNRGLEANSALQEFDRIRVAGELFTVRATTANNTELIILDVPSRNYYASPYYVETQKSSRQASGALRQLLTFHEIDETLPDFIANFQDTFLRNFSRVGTDYTVLIPQILSFYQSRGSEDSFRFLFRALFGQEISLTYPREYVFSTSDSRYERPSIIRLSATPYSEATPEGLQFGQESSGNVYALENRTIVGLTSNVRAQIARVRTEQLGTLSAVSLNLTDYVINDQPFGIVLDVDEPGLMLTNVVTFTLRTTNTTMVASSNVASFIRRGSSLYIANSVSETVRITVANVAANGTHLLLTATPTANVVGGSAYAVNTTGGRLLSAAFGIPPDQRETTLYYLPFIQEQKSGITFEPGERVSTLPLEDPLRIQGTILGSVVNMEVQDGGNGFAVGDLIYVPQISGQIEGFGSVGRVSALSQTQISEVLVEEPGEGYYEGLSVVVDNSGTGGSGLAGFVSDISAGQVLTEDSDVLMFDASASEREDIIYFEEGVALADILLLNNGSGSNANILISSADWSQSNTLSALYGLQLPSLVNEILAKLDIVPIYIDGVVKPIGEVRTITVTSDGKGYVSGLPVITITIPVRPRTAGGIEVSSAVLPFINAELIVGITPAIIGSVEVIAGGSGYGASGTFTVTPERTSSLSGNGAVIRIASGAVSSGRPRFADTRSQTSAQQFLQDESTYQPFAYILSSETDAPVYRDMVKQFVHPAGAKLIAERLITSTGNVSVSGTATVS